MALMKRAWSAAVLLAAVMVIPAGSLAAEDIPVEDLLKDPLYRQARLSPEGMHLAILVSRWDTMNLAVINLATNEPLVITREAQDISRYYWVNNDRLIYMTDRATDVELERTGGIFAIDKDGSNRRVLVTPPLGVGGDVSVSNPVWRSYIGSHPDDDDLIFVTNNSRDRRYPDVYTIDVNNGRERRALINEWNARGYFQDSQNEIRFAVGGEGIDETIIHFLNPDSGEWEVLMKSSGIGLEWSPVAFDPKEDYMYVSTNFGRDTVAVFRMNWRTKEMDAEPVLALDAFDVEPMLLTQGKGDDRRVAGFYYETVKMERHMLNPAMERLHKMIDATLPRTFNRIVNSREDGKVHLILSSSDRIMPTYNLLDLEKGSMNELAYTTPWIDPRDLGERRPFQFTASDGITVHGYLTLPVGYEDGTPLPLLVNPHGGPWARDSWALEWYFSMEPHFFATRGFITLQVNFRGSTGFGRKFYRGARNNIGRMHGDVMEAIDWAIEEGYAHPDRVAIGGASWGGYQTLLGITKEPDRFQFGINIFGVVDLATQVNRYISWGREEAFDWWVEWFGNPRESEGRDYLAQWSPLTHIDNIKAPVFTYHGLRDLNVDIEQARILTAELKRRNHPHTVKLDTDEMHGMENEELRLTVYRMIDEFILPFRKEWGLME
jgi:prolyl oligopeptidase PreP (S9A serine peptidase family)